MIRYIIPWVSSSIKLEQHYPDCGRFGGNIHRGIKYRAISDIKASSIPQRQMKCPFRKTTWTIRAEDIADGKQRTDRLIAIGVILYMFGLSYRFVEKFFTFFRLYRQQKCYRKGCCPCGSKGQTFALKCTSSTCSDFGCRRHRSKDGRAKIFLQKII